MIRKPAREAWCPKCRCERPYRRVPCCRTCKTPVQRKRRIGPRSQRATPVARLKRQCDEAWGMIVRAPGRCCICGKTEQIQAAHGFSRRYAGTRFELDNGFPLCAGDHKRYTHDPEGWTALLRQWWGAEKYERLLVQSQARVRFREDDYRRILLGLQAVRARVA